MIGLLAGLSTAALAEWTKIDTAVAGSVERYLDKATIRKVGNITRVWVLDDYLNVKWPPSVGRREVPKSGKEQVEFNCDVERARITSAVYYNAAMGAGQIMGSEDIPSRWTPVVPESLTETTMKLACALPSDR